MPDCVIETAQAFTFHANECPTCMADGRFCCPVGDKLLKDFHDALNSMLNQRPYDA